MMHDTQVSEIRLKLLEVSVWELSLYLQKGQYREVGNVRVGA